MRAEQTYKILHIGIAAVWFVNGLVCKVMQLVPRHEQIVAGILGTEYAHPLTILIGLSEVMMALWIISRVRTKLNAIAQIVVVATMNLLELIFVPDLLLWGKFNSLFAACFMMIVGYNEFVLKKT